MMTTSWGRAKEIFLDARELTPASRAAFLERACEGDATLRGSVDTLLAAEGDAGRFLSEPTGDAQPPTQRFAAGEVFARLQHAVAGRYSLERELGRGGMGIVFLARDVALDRLVAIKLLPPELAAVAEHRARFLREARTAARLSHPNIVPIHLVEEHGDVVFFVMTLIDGESLSQRVKRAGPLKAPEAAKLTQEIAWALSYAHANGVIHRDVKPDNVLIEKGSGRALVSDFGIARVTTSGTLSMRGEVMGTLRYMSPEQATGQSDIDGRSDLYSLGVTSFYALTGRLPFEAKDPTALLAMHIGHPAPPVRSVNPAVPTALAEAVDRCLAKDPAARWADGGALATAIADAKITRREIAPSVREFIVAGRNAITNYGILFMISWAMAEALPRLRPSGPMLGHPLDPMFAVLYGFGGIALLIPLNAARGVVRAGMDERDVADAIKAFADARDANTEYEMQRVEGMARRLGNPLARGTMFLFFAAMGSFLPQVIFQLMGMPSSRISESTVAAGMMLVIFLVSMTFLGALAGWPRQTVAIISPGTPERASALSRLWSGPIGRAFFWVAGLGLKRAPRVASSSASAPTEVLLGKAAGALFDQLPADQRRRLGDVHEVIRGLERAAASLRSRQDELSRIAAEVGGGDDSPHRAALLADLEAARAPVEARMQQAVSALEKLRLDLLRLRAGVGNADDLTLAVEEAESIRHSVELELSAAAEVNSRIST